LRGQQGDFLRDRIAGLTVGVFGQCADFVEFQQFQRMVGADGTVVSRS
jgi:hypothetical protein